MVNRPTSYVPYVHWHPRMIQSNVYGKSSQSWDWLYKLEKKLKIGISKNDCSLYYILIEYNVNTIESSKLRKHN